MYYSCVLEYDLVPVCMESCGYEEHWKEWLEAIMFLYMDDWFPPIKTGFERKSKELTVLDKTGLLQKSKSEVIILVMCLVNSLKLYTIASIGFMKQFSDTEKVHCTIIELLCGQPTGRFLKPCVMA